MKRRWIALLSLAALMAASIALSGCNKGEDTSKKNDTPEVQQQRQQKSGD